MPSKHRQALLTGDNIFVTILTEKNRISTCRKIKNLARDDSLRTPDLVTESTDW
jgi:hypothetical protein